MAFGGWSWVPNASVPDLCILFAFFKIFEFAYLFFLTCLRALRHMTQGIVNARTKSSLMPYLYHYDIFVPVYYSVV